jgi:AraC-like DNA-binding protein
MSTLIRVDDLPAPERLERWREALAQLRGGAAEVGSDHEDDFRFELRTSDLGAVRVSRVTAVPYWVRRPSRLIRESDPDLLTVGMLLHGDGILVQNDRECHVPPAAFTLYEGCRPYRLGIRGPGGTRPARALILNFPRALLPLPPGQLGRLLGVPMPATPGIGTLTSRLLVRLAEGMDHYRPVEAARLSTVALEVLATRLAHELDSEDHLPPETRTHALLARAHAFIQQHLGDPELSPGMIAAAHHVSLSYLHKLFQRDGATVAGWIRRCRLEACRRDLADPALAPRPVAAVAARWGFTSAAHFSQVYKAVYGMPPGEYRRWARLSPVSTDGQAVHGSASTVD